MDEGLNILIVDDSAVMRRMIARTIEMTGIPVAHVFEAADGEAALALLAAQQVELVFLDITMPVMSGYDVLRKMRSEPAMMGIPTIVISADQRDARQSEIAALGASFIRKPFTPEQVVAAIEALMEQNNAIA